MADKSADDTTFRQGRELEALARFLSSTTSQMVQNILKSIASDRFDVTFEEQTVEDVSSFLTSALPSKGRFFDTSWPAI